MKEQRWQGHPKIFYCQIISEFNDCHFIDNQKKMP